MSKCIIVGILIPSRSRNVPEVQKVLTDYGCNIKTRLGLHDVSDSACSPTGLIVLETFGDEAAIAEMEAKLKAIDGVQIQQMAFDL